MLYLLMIIYTLVAISFGGVVISVWKMLSDQKYLRQNEFSMILKVTIAVLNCIISISSVV